MAVITNGSLLGRPDGAAATWPARRHRAAVSGRCRRGLVPARQPATRESRHSTSWSTGMVAFRAALRRRDLAGGHAPRRRHGDRRPGASGSPRLAARIAPDRIQLNTVGAPAGGVRSRAPVSTERLEQFAAAVHAARGGDRRSARRSAGDQESPAAADVLDARVAAAVHGGGHGGRSGDPSRRQRSRRPPRSSSAARQSCTPTKAERSTLAAPAADLKREEEKA